MSCMNVWVSDINFFSVSTIFQLDLRTVPTLRQCGIFCFSFYCWQELCWHSDSVVYFVFHFIVDKNCADTQTVWYILFSILLLTRTVPTLRQCGIFCFSFYCWQELCWHSDSVVYFVFHFIADKDCVDTQTVWYILFFILLLTRTL